MIVRGMNSYVSIKFSMQMMSSYNQSNDTPHFD